MKEQWNGYQILKANKFGKQKWLWLSPATIQCSPVLPAVASWPLLHRPGFQNLQLEMPNRQYKCCSCICSDKSRDQLACEYGSEEIRFQCAICFKFWTIDISRSSDQEIHIFFYSVQYLFFWVCSENSRTPHATLVLSTGLVLQKVPPQGWNSKFMEAEYSSTAGRGLSSCSLLGMPWFEAHPFNE